MHFKFFFLLAIPDSLEERIVMIIKIIENELFF